MVQTETNWQPFTNIMTRFFIGRSQFCTTNLGIWYFFGQQTYIHFVAQETRIIKKLFIFAKVVFLLEFVVIINKS